MMEQDVIKELFDSMDCSYKKVSYKHENIIELSYRSFLNKGDVAIDIGAHKGSHTWPMSDAVGENGVVHAFEAINRLYVTLLLQQKAKKINNVKLYHLPVAEVQKDIKFTIFTGNEGLSGIVARDDLEESCYEHMQELSMHACPLDGLLPETLPVKYIKIDIEGGEYHALKGAVKLLTRQRPIIAFENGRQATADLYGYSKDEFWTFFENLDYLVFDIAGVPFNRDTWDTKRPNWNYFAMPSEKKYEIEMLPTFALQVLNGVIK